MHPLFSLQTTPGLEQRGTGTGSTPRVESVVRGEGAIAEVAGDSCTADFGHEASQQDDGQLLLLNPPVLKRVSAGPVGGPHARAADTLSGADGTRLLNWLRAAGLQRLQVQMLVGETISVALLRRLATSLTGQRTPTDDSRALADYIKHAISVLDAGKSETVSSVELWSPWLAPEPTQASFLDDILESVKRGDRQLGLDLMAYDAMRGRRPWSEVQRAIHASDADNVARPIAGSYWLEEFVLDAAAMLPAMGRGFLEGQKVGGMLGMATGAMTAATLGQAGPQVLLPEEVITVPVAAMMGYSAGSMYGAAEFWRNVGAGSMFRELKQQAVTDRTAARCAEIAGVPYALIELSQVGKLLPGADAALRRIVFDTVIEAVGKVATRQGREIAVESLEEGLQGAVAQATVEIGRYLDQQEAQNSATTSAIRVFKRGWNDFVESIGPMSVLSSPKGIRRTLSATAQTLKQQRTPAASPASDKKSSGRLPSENPQLQGTSRDAGDGSLQAHEVALDELSAYVDGLDVVTKLQVREGELRNAAAEEKLRELGGKANEALLTHYRDLGLQADFVTLDGYLAIEIIDSPNRVFKAVKASPRWQHVRILVDPVNTSLWELIAYQTDGDLALSAEEATWLTHDIGVSGPFLHEIRHEALSLTSSIFNGDIEAEPGYLLPVGRNAYTEGFSLQELSTFYRQLQQYTGKRASQARSRIPSPDKQIWDPDLVESDNDDASSLLKTYDELSTFVTEEIRALQVGITARPQEVDYSSYYEALLPIYNEEGRKVATLRIPLDESEGPADPRNPRILENILAQLRETISYQRQRLQLLPLTTPG